MELLLLLAGGLVLLILGGEFFVRAAVALSVKLGVSPLLIGLTVVAFGTSLPELVTSVQASLLGSPGIALGNIVGSNIANILLILGISALLCPVPVARAALLRDGVLGAVVMGGFVLLGLFWTLDRAAGGLLVAGLVGYLIFAWSQEKRAADGPDLTGEPVRVPPPLWRTLLLLSAGLVMIVLGGRFLVDAGVSLSRTLGVTEEVIGLTVVAVGTSLPELVTSVIAAIRRQADVALGNVLGSNIYNILGIGGATGLIAPTIVPDAIARFDAPVALAVALLLLVLARLRWKLSRWDGALLVGCYVLYVWWLWPTA